MSTFADFFSAQPGRSTMSVDLAHIRQVMAEADCLFNNDEVEAAI
ncbi:MAG: hypoxanthine-guanine phosphoribosyltransferase, partial [Pseudomonas aeruginosa]|nr:hypoxanthine-guanine phosphoribosyltransferase [Pseudomonas aeruginosa]